MLSHLKNKFVYVPGQRPTPMLMVFNEPNKETFHSDNFKIYGHWNKYDKCMWSISAYIIYNDKNEVVAYSFQEFANLTWLLRMINLPLTIYVDDETKEIIKKHYKEELEEV